MTVDEKPEFYCCWENNTSGVDWPHYFLNGPTLIEMENGF